MPQLVSNGFAYFGMFCLAVVVLAVLYRVLYDAYFAFDYRDYKSEAYAQAAKDWTKIHDQLLLFMPRWTLAVRPIRCGSTEISKPALTSFLAHALPLQSITGQNPIPMQRQGKPYRALQDGFPC